MSNDEWDAWPNCAVPGCTNKCCLRLHSKYCWPHTVVFAGEALTSVSVEYKHELIEPHGPTLATIRTRAIVEFERAIEKRARELTEGMPTEFNLTPVKDLVRRAFSMGYDVIRPSPEHVNPA